MRPIDAGELMERLRKRFYMHDIKSDFDRCARSVILSCMEAVQRATTICEPPNDPLTLEELREMDGEPVWCVDGRGNQCWCLVNCDDGLPCCYDNETGLWEDCFYRMTGDGKFGLHQSSWIAYRRKPEEGMK